MARVLIEVGVGPERAVGVAMDRCAELVVAWWAVLKAGGTYVPVDRAHPVERVATVLDAVGAVCVLLVVSMRWLGLGGVRCCGSTTWTCRGVVGIRSPMPSGWRRRVWLMRRM